MKLRGILLLGVLGFAGLSACIRDPEPPPPPRVVPTPALSEEDIQPDPTVRIDIVDLKDTQEPNSRRVTVVGTLINRGTKATSQVNVQLRALDESGATVLQIAAVPSTERIAANGGTARFTAEFDADPAIRSYHVEALAR